MTNREYLTATLSKFSLSETDVELIAINQEIYLDEDVSDVKSLKTAIYNEFSFVLPLANISEGGLSISWNFEAVKKYYSLLAQELGLDDVLNDAQDKDYAQKCHIEQMVKLSEYELQKIYFEVIKELTKEEHLLDMVIPMYVEKDLINKG